MLRPEAKREGTTAFFLKFIPCFIFCTSVFFNEIIRPKDQAVQYTGKMYGYIKNYNPYLDEIMDSYNYLLKNKIRHAFGDFLDLIYVQKIK